MKITVKNRRDIYPTFVVDCGRFKMEFELGTSDEAASALIGLLRELAPGLAADEGKTIVGWLEDNGVQLPKEEISGS